MPADGVAQGGMSDRARRAHTHHHYFVFITLKPGTKAAARAARAARQLKRSVNDAEKMEQ
jgi:hypothetical protein